VIVVGIPGMRKLIYSFDHLALVPDTLSPKLLHRFFGSGVDIFFRNSTQGATLLLPCKETECGRGMGDLGLRERGTSLCHTLSLRPLDVSGEEYSRSRVPRPHPSATLCHKTRDLGTRER